MYWLLGHSVSARYKKTLQVVESHNQQNQQQLNNKKVKLSKLKRNTQFSTAHSATEKKR